jgi:3-hydroxybutyryl-CoA dehydratase
LKLADRGEHSPRPQGVAFRSLEELEEGMFHERRVVMTLETLAAFIHLSGDEAPLHVDGAHARSLGFNGTIIHGMLVGSFYSGMLGMALPGANTVIQQITQEMTAPVYVGDAVTYRVTVQRIIPSVQAVQMALRAVNQTGLEIGRGKATCVFRQESGSSVSAAVNGTRGGVEE